MKTNQDDIDFDKLLNEDIKPNFLESGILKDTFNYGMPEKELSSNIGFERAQSLQSESLKYCDSRVSSFLF